MLRSLVEKLGTMCHEELGIDVRTDEGLFEWFLASVLLGARIRESVAMRTFEEFKKEGLLSCDVLLKAGWGRLVEVLDAGGYVRYDFKTADKLLELAKKLRGKSLVKLLQLRDAKLLLRELRVAKGIGPTTLHIFLRELREEHNIEDLPHSELALKAAERLGVGRDLGTLASQLGVKASRLEVALIRLFKDYCKFDRCRTCPAGEACRSRHEGPVRPR